MSADPVAVARDLLRCPSVTPAEGGALTYLEGVLEGARLYGRARDVLPNPATTTSTISMHGSARLRRTSCSPAIPMLCRRVMKSKWTHRPFAGNIADGVLYGRGAVDMKGGIACFVAAALDYLAANGGKPRGSISFLDHRR